MEIMVLMKNSLRITGREMDSSLWLDAETAEIVKSIEGADAGRDMMPLEEALQLGK